MTSILTHPIVQLASLVLGIVLLVACVRQSLRAREVADGPTVELGRLVWLGRGLRCLLSALACIGLAAGGYFEMTWLVWASVAFGLEELYEVSMALACVRYAEEVERDYAATH